MFDYRRVLDQKHWWKNYAWSILEQKYVIFGSILEKDYLRFVLYLQRCGSQIMDLASAPGLQHFEALNAVWLC